MSPLQPCVGLCVSVCMFLWLHAMVGSRQVLSRQQKIATVTLHHLAAHSLSAENSCWHRVTYCRECVCMCVCTVCVFELAEVLERNVVVFWCRVCFLVWESATQREEDLVINFCQEKGWKTTKWDKKWKERNWKSNGGRKEGEWIDVRIERRKGWERGEERHMFFNVRKNRMESARRKSGWRMINARNLKLLLSLITVSSVVCTWCGHIWSIVIKQHISSQIVIQMLLNQAQRKRETQKYLKCVPVGPHHSVKSWLTGF